MNVYVFWAALITTIGALVIAFVAYPWQRRLDRDSELMREKRQKYDQFIRATNYLFYSTYWSLQDQDQKNSRIEYMSKAHKCYLLASKELGKKLDAHIGTVADYLKYHDEQELFDNQAEEFLALK
ncbi:MAG: hypothetical protein P8X43_00835, partial [Maritimibacter sp.]